MGCIQPRSVDSVGNRISSDNLVDPDEISDSGTFASTTEEERDQLIPLQITVEDCEGKSINPIKPYAQGKGIPEQFCSAKFASLIAGANLMSAGSNMFSSMEFSSLSHGVGLESSNSIFPGEQTYTVHQKYFSTRTPTEILPTLFLGSKEDSTREERLKELEITHILMVTSGKQYPVPDCKLLSVPMADNGNTDLFDIMERTFDFINEGQRSSNKLLVHCNHGQNRSPSIVIAWLMQERKKSLHDAYLFVKAKRDLVQPHKLYIQQLRELDWRLYGVYSVKPDFLSMSLDDGELVIMDENWTKNDSTKYITSQKFEKCQSSGDEFYKKPGVIDESQDIKNHKKDTPVLNNSSHEECVSTRARDPLSSKEIDDSKIYEQKSSMDLDFNDITLPFVNKSSDCSSCETVEIISGVEVVQQKTNHPQERSNRSKVQNNKYMNSEEAEHFSLTKTSDNRPQIQCI